MSKSMLRCWILCLLAAVAGAPLSAKDKPLEEKSFELGKSGEEILVFEISRPGTIRARAHIRAPMVTAPLKLLLEGPDGTLVEKESSAPLSMRYRVESSAQLGAWRLRVISVGKVGVIRGSAEIFFEPSAGAVVEPKETSPPAEELTSSEPAPPEPAPPPRAEPAASSPPSDPVTDGRVVTPRDPNQLRAVCRDQNTDVFVRLDLGSRTGGFYMRYNQVFDLAVTRIGEQVIEMRGSGEVPLYLDRENNSLFFVEGEQGVFCRVRIHVGGD